MFELELDELVVNTDDMHLGDELEQVPDYDFFWTDEDKRAHYREMFEDVLCVWTKEDVEEALECGALEDYEAASIVPCDPFERAA